MLKGRRKAWKKTAWMNSLEDQMQQTRREVHSNVPSRKAKRADNKSG